MNTMKKMVILPAVLVACALPVAAADNEQTEDKFHDAWLDGKLDTVILLNRHLNPFKIDSDVKNGEAILTGEVDSDVEKSLATELAKSIKGITRVDNQLQVKADDMAHNDNDRDNGKSVVENGKDNISDAAITTAISTKLLLNTEINSFHIDVDTKQKVVELNGTVENAEEKALVEQIAKNTMDVKTVHNKLQVKSSS